MTDSLSLASGAIALVTYSIRVSKTLHKSLKVLQNHTSDVRQIEQDLEALQGIFQALEKLAIANVPAEYTTIEPALYRCGRACSDFNAMITECIGRSTRSQPSFHDCANLQYMDNDISSKNGIQQYRETIRNAKADLEDHLRRIVEKLPNVSSNESCNGNATVKRHAQEGKDSVQQSLDIGPHALSSVKQNGTIAIHEQSTPSDLPHDCGDAGASQLSQPVVHYSERYSKGKFIAGGASSIVELSASGSIIKSPWPGFENDMCREDLTREALIYEALGLHERFVKIEHWDPDECVLTMEYMPNGCLRDYMEQHDSEIPSDRRLQWALETAEGLHLLHSADVVHCDMKPKNLLLDGDLRIKVADFGSSSFRGSKPTGCAGTRYMPPGNYNAFSVRVDLFALGSTIYKMMTGKDPYEEIPSGEVWPLYQEERFPDVATVHCGEIIQKCWLGQFGSAQEVYDAIKSHVLSSASE